jgi:prepilin-type N-terminal cleavage/methylation domain-containing protein
MKVKKAFTLIEIMIVVVILGILAVCVITNVQAYATETKETACKESLRILRDTIQLYAAKHKDVPPGYTNDDPTQTVDYTIFLQQIVDGRYLPKLPKNPFNESNTMTLLGNDDSFPAEAPGGDAGWIYKPATKEIRLNWLGTDSDEMRYYDY